MFKSIFRARSCYRYPAATTGRDVGLDQSNEAAICIAVPHADRVLRGAPNGGDLQIDPPHSTSSTLGHQREGTHCGKIPPRVRLEEMISQTFLRSVNHVLFCSHHSEIFRTSTGGMVCRILSLKRLSWNAANSLDATLCRNPIYHTCCRVSGKSRKSTPPVTGTR